MKYILFVSLLCISTIFADNKRIHSDKIQEITNKISSENTKAIIWKPGLLQNTSIVLGFFYSLSSFNKSSNIDSTLTYFRTDQTEKEVAKLKFHGQMSFLLSCLNFILRELKQLKSDIHISRREIYTKQLDALSKQRFL